MMDKQPGDMTPEQVDTELSHLSADLISAYRGIDHQLAMARHAAGEVPLKSTKRGLVWRSIPEVARERLVARAKLNQGNIWTSNETTILQNLIKKEQEAETIGARIGALEDEYHTRPWQRFFLVTSSAGHIHSSRSCRSCTPETTYRWLPTLAGKTEAEAVADHGPLLCSVCFPTAPVEWTKGPTRDHCPGINPVPDTIITWARGAYGECPDCHQRVALKQGYALRRHQPPKKSSKGETT